MKKISIIALMIGLCCLEVFSIIGSVNAQEVPHFVIDWGDDEPIEPTDPAPVTPTTPDSDPEVTTPPVQNTVPVVAAPALPNQITQTTTLSSSGSEYHGGSNKFQIIRRNFSKQKQRSTVSIDQVIARNTTLSNSTLTAKAKPPIIKLKKRSVAITPTPTENIVAIDKSLLFAGATHVAQFGTLDSNTKPIEATSTARVKQVVQSVKKTIKRQVKTVSTTKNRITQNNTALIEFSTVPNEFKKTTLSSNSNLKQDLNYYEWVKSAKNIWNFLITILQIAVVIIFFRKIYQIYNKKIALQILAHSRRKKRLKFVSKKIPSNIVPRETFAFDCNKIRSMRPNRPYYHIFPTSSY